MRSNPGFLVVLLVVLLNSACASRGYFATAAAAASPGFATTGKMGVAVDEVTNGLQGNVALGRELVSFRDAGDVDVRVRPESASQDRMLVHTGRIGVEVARPEQELARFLAQVQVWGGHLHSQVGTTLTVRIPASRFDEAFEGLRRLGRVISESKQARDVTEEYLDIEIRLDNAKSARDRLLALLDKAEKVEDILAIEKELRRLTDEIETMEGRRKYLADQVALATLTVEFRATSEPPPDQRRRRPSRFRWLNFVGAERVMEDF